MNPLESIRLDCPYCGEENELMIDTSVPFLEYVEDCTVCCRPMQLRITVSDSCELDVQVTREGD